MPTGTRECYYEVRAGDVDSDGIDIRANAISGTALGTAPPFKVDGEVTTYDIFYYIMNNPYETLYQKATLTHSTVPANAKRIASTKPLPNGNGCPK